MRLDVFVHFVNDAGSCQPAVVTLGTQLDALLRKGTKLMANLDEVLARLQEIDGKLDTVRARGAMAVAQIASLQQEIAALLANASLPTGVQEKIDQIAALATSLSQEVDQVFPPAEGTTQPTNPTPMPADLPVMTAPPSEGGTPVEQPTT